MFSPLKNHQHMHPQDNNWEWQGNVSENPQFHAWSTGMYLLPVSHQRWHWWGRWARPCGTRRCCSVLPQPHSPGHSSPAAARSEEKHTDHATRISPQHSLDRLSVKQRRSQSPRLLEQGALQNRNLFLARSVEFWWDSSDLPLKPQFTSFWNPKDCKLILSIILNCRFKPTTFTLAWILFCPFSGWLNARHTSVIECGHETKSNLIFFSGCYLTFSIALFLLPVTPYIALSIDDKATKELDWVLMVRDTTSAGFSVSLLDCSLIYKLETNIGNFESTLFWNQSSWRQTLTII